MEIAVLFPLLLIMLSGLIEFGFFLNEYLTIQDAIRNAARFSSDSDYNITDISSVCDGNPAADTFPRQLCCRETVNIYRQTACLTNNEITSAAPDISLLCLDDPLPAPGEPCRYGIVNPNNGEAGNRDDIVISVFSVLHPDSGTASAVRFPIESGESGWSYAQASPEYGIRNQNSSFSTTEFVNRLGNDAPSTGFLLVEIFYNYDQKLKLPWITAFVPDPILLHNFAIMPLVSAEPTPTPIAPAAP